MRTFLFPTGKEDGKTENVMYPTTTKCKVTKLLNDKHLSSSSEKLTLFKNSGGPY